MVVITISSNALMKYAIIYYRETMRLSTAHVNICKQIKPIS